MILLAMRINQFDLNKLTIDQFGKVSGILALDKSPSITSHDLVDEVRKKLNTRRVGHAGTLDPFATGLMIILVGRATKLANELQAEDKEYFFNILFGVSTDTQDPEGNVINVSEVTDLEESTLAQTLKTFEGSQQQISPLFSSVKVRGIRLRELARNSEKFEKENDIVTFYLKDGSVKSLQLPKREVVIHKIHLNKLSPIVSNDLPFQVDQIKKELKFMVANITAHVSKGTYIRQLAEDIGAKLGMPAMLLTLKRTKVGEISLEQVTDLDNLAT